MFKYNFDKLDNNLGISIGVKIDLHGQLVYGSPPEDFEKFKEFCRFVEAQAKSEVVVIDLTSLEEWHSIAIKLLIPKIQEINASNIKRKPVSLIGKKDTDVFAGIFEKHKDVGTGNLPFFESFEEFKSKNLNLGY